MTTNAPQPAAAPDGGEKPAGRTGEGSESIVAELAEQELRVDQLINRVGRSEPESDPEVEAD